MWRSDFALRQKAAPTGDVKFEFRSALAPGEDVVGHEAVLQVSGVTTGKTRIVVMLPDGVTYVPGSVTVDGERATDKPEQVVGAGEAMRIFTGAPLPDGTDAVIPQEDVVASGTHVTVQSATEPGAYVRPAGEDVRHGDLVLEAGTLLGAAEIGLLAALGRTQVEVSRRPRVAVLSTGSELADLGIEPGPAQISNANTYSLMAQSMTCPWPPRETCRSAARMPNAR